MNINASLVSVLGGGRINLRRKVSAYELTAHNHLNLATLLQAMHNKQTTLPERDRHERKKKARIGSELKETRKYTQ